jgi:hypothetical protein
MKFVYLDESGIGEEPIGIMVGVIADSYRMRPTKEAWNGLLAALSKIIGRPIDEIHTRDFYSGNSPWRDLKGDQRSAIISVIFKWLQSRKHAIVFSAVDKSKFNNSFSEESVSRVVATLWRFMVLHVALSLQKYFQGSPRGKSRTVNQKGNFVLIFDNESREEKHFTDLLLNAPDWTDSYYSKLPKQEKLNQIVDVPHFVDSKDVGLIQLADFICFFLRKHFELQMGYADPKYGDEKKKVAGWSKMILEQSIPKNNCYLSRGRCECSDLFCKYAPDIIL